MAGGATRRTAGGSRTPGPAVPLPEAPRWAVLPAQVPLEETWVVVPVDPPPSPDVTGMPLAGGALATDDD